MSINRFVAACAKAANNLMAPRRRAPVAVRLLPYVLPESALAAQFRRTAVAKGAASTLPAQTLSEYAAKIDQWCEQIDSGQISVVIAMTEAAGWLSRQTYAIDPRTKYHREVLRGAP